MINSIQPTGLSDLKSKDLLIISHTQHYQDNNGEVYGWTPTIREIDFLAIQFKSVVHLAVLQKGEPPKSTTKYISKNVSFRAIPPYGGSGLINKLRILKSSLNSLVLIRQLLQNSDYFHFRAPTSIGLFVIPFLVMSKKKGWFKYAGNWNQPDAPISYRIQKQFLINQSKAVTINGKWKNQNAHVHSFENPCVNSMEIELSRNQITKNKTTPFIGCFVGRLDDLKGVDKIVDLLLYPDIDKKIKKFHFVGDSKIKEGYIQKLKQCKIDIVFHGFLNRNDTFLVYEKSDFLFLPSKSEGFPKVIAEAASKGCIPIVSNVGSIGQYINSSNGFLWEKEHDTFLEFFRRLDLSDEQIKIRRENIYELAEKFTFERYIMKLEQTVF